MVRASNGSGRFKMVADLFDRALDLPEREQDTFLTSACAGDAELLSELRGLLAAHRRTGALDRLSGNIASDVEAALPASAELGAQIGAYRVLERLGSGGMGVVYLAEREGEGFHQRVAIKVLHHALLGDTRGIVPRFLSERSILSLLEHPNIPRFLDGGLTRDGVPYFAMEYVEGTPIDRYCDEHDLSVRQRLSLFLSVCDAMQYAHRHLVVHRDLKPSNILITSDGIPKVLDFGIAKILNLPEGETAILTDAGQRWMTPNYASPEQVRGDAVTTAADVFALGVLMYELLACIRPHGGKSRHEVERAILETEPMRPSEALQASVCEARGENPARLRRELAGDVDTIALKALSKAPERRYHTAGELADDIRRYLAGFPVLARGDTFAYRAGKFIARHRILVIAGAVAAISLIAGTAASAIAWRRERVAASSAKLERDRAEEVSRFAVGLFSAADPRAALGPEVSARALLDSAAAKVRRGDVSDPVRRASLLQVLSQSYLGLARHDEAQALAAEAVALRRAERPVRPDALAEALEMQARVFNERWMPDSIYAPASEAIRLRRLGGSREAPASAFLLMGEYYHTHRRPDSAQHYFTAAIDAARAGADTATLAQALVGLSIMLVQRKQLAQAESLQLSVRDMLRASYPSGHPTLSSAMIGLVMTRTKLGKMAEAQETMREIIAMRTRALGPRHPDIAQHYHNLAYLFIEAQQLDSAVVWLNRSAALKREVMGPNHPSLATTLSRLGAVRRLQGDLVAAESLLARAAAIYRTSALRTPVEVASARVTDSLLRVVRAARR